MTEDDFPALFLAADEQAKASQRLFLALQRLEVGALVAAALFAIVDWSPNGLHAGALVSACLFVIAVSTSLFMYATHPEKDWYDARAVAESVKTLAWQFSVGGEALPLSDHDAARTFEERAVELAHGFPGLTFPAAPKHAQVTPQMVKLRNSNLHERMRVYRSGRVSDQQAWYSKKADFNRIRGTRWLLVLLGIEGLAAMLGLLRGIGLFDVDWAGVLAASAAGVTAWRQTKQYAALSEAYAVTSHDVAALATRLGDAADEDSWATRVHDAEAAFSREHTRWLARRQSPRL